MPTGGKICSVGVPRDVFQGSASEVADLVNKFMQKGASPMKVRKVETVKPTGASRGHG